MLASFPPIGDPVATAVPPQIPGRKGGKVHTESVGHVNRIDVRAVTGELSLVTNLTSISGGISRSPWTNAPKRTKRM